MYTSYCFAFLWHFVVTRTAHTRWRQFVSGKSDSGFERENIDFRCAFSFPLSSSSRHSGLISNLLTIINHKRVTSLSISVDKHVENDKCLFFKLNFP